MHPDASSSIYYERLCAPEIVRFYIKLQHVAASYMDVCILDGALRS